MVLNPKLHPAVGGGRRRSGSMHQDSLARALGHVVTLERLIAMVHTRIAAHYQSTSMQKRLKPGRHLHEGQIVLAVDAHNAIIHGAIRFAIACEVIGQSIGGEYVLQEIKRA